LCFGPGAHILPFMSEGKDHHADSTRWGAWLAAAQDGDNAAYNCLLGELVPVVRRMAAGKRNDSHDLEDVVQDVLLTLHNIRHTYDPTRPFMPWFTTIVGHRINDSLRKSYRQNSREKNIDDVPETFLQVPANTQSTDSMDLRKAVAHLPDGQRQAVELLKLKGMSLAEASAASGQSVGALKVAVHRAIKTLKGLMDP
jgi:RNA polymerase sigma factor (sigma-70 family)